MEIYSYAVNYCGSRVICCQLSAGVPPFIILRLHVYETPSSMMYFLFIVEAGGMTYMPPPQLALNPVVLFMRACHFSWL